MNALFNDAYNRKLVHISVLFTLALAYERDREALIKQHQRELKKARKQRKRALAASGEAPSPVAAAAPPDPTPSPHVVADLRQQLARQSSLLESTRKRMRREVRQV